MSEFNRLALLVSDAPRAQEAAADEFRAVADWVPLEEADAVVVLGGDGTFLRAAQVVADVEVPILGVNVGKIGFLSKVENHALEDVLGQLRDGDYVLEPRLMLEVRVRDATGQETDAELAEQVAQEFRSAVGTAYASGLARLNGFATAARFGANRRCHRRLGAV